MNSKSEFGVFHVKRYTVAMLQTHVPPPSLAGYTNRLFGHQRRYAKRLTAAAALAPVSRRAVAAPAVGLQHVSCTSFDAEKDDS